LVSQALPQTVSQAKIALFFQPVSQGARTQAISAKKTLGGGRQQIQKNARPEQLFRAKANARLAWSPTDKWCFWPLTHR